MNGQRGNCNTSAQLQHRLHRTALFHHYADGVSAQEAVLLLQQPPLEQAPVGVKALGMPLWSHVTWGGSAAHLP